ncbi:Hypothetical protein FKW44_011061, partial [Caligus rogercresseyi]
LERKKRETFHKDHGVFIITSFSPLALNKVIYSSRSLPLKALYRRPIRPKAAILAQGPPLSESSSFGSLMSPLGTRVLGVASLKPSICDDEATSSS